MDTARAAPVHTTVVGVFDDQAHARAAVEALRQAGFADKLVKLLGPRTRRAGIKEENRDWFEKELDDGKVLVTVHEADERAEEARDILRRHHGAIHQPTDIGTYGTGLPATPY